MMELLNLIIEKYTLWISILALIGVEIAPIKLSPITWIGKWVSKWLGITELDTKINNLKQEVDINELDRIRYEILQFSGSLRNGLKRTEIDYQHIEDVYKKYTAKHGNSYISHEMEFIRECHDKGMIL